MLCLCVLFFGSTEFPVFVLLRKVIFLAFIRIFRYFPSLCRYYLLNSHQRFSRVFKENVIKLSLNMTEYGRNRSLERSGKNHLVFKVCIDMGT